MKIRIPVFQNNSLNERILRSGLVSQLRATPFTSGLISGTEMTIANGYSQNNYGYYEFEILGADLTKLLKLYVSADNVTFEQVTTWGGTDGIRQKEYRLFSSRVSATNVVVQQIGVNELDTVSSITYGAFDTQIVVVFASNVFATDYKTAISIGGLDYYAGLKNANFNFVAATNTITIYAINPTNGNALSFSTSELFFTLEIKIYP